MSRSPHQRHDGSRRGGHGPAVGGRARRTIALVGIDGSGKTTQTRRLAGLLTAAGEPATHWRNAGGRRWFGRLARRVGRHDAQRLLGRPGLLVTESVLRWLAIARALLESVLRGRTAVMDRYSFCQYASIRVHGGRRWEFLARAAYRLFRPPDVTILLTVDPAEAYRRIEARGTDHESLEYLTAAAAAYRSLPEFPGFAVVDANQSPDEVARAIWDVLEGRPRDERVRPDGPRDRPDGPSMPVNPAAGSRPALARPPR